MNHRVSLPMVKRLYDFLSSRALAVNKWNEKRYLGARGFFFFFFCYSAKKSLKHDYT